MPVSNAAAALVVAYDVVHQLFSVSVQADVVGEAARSGRVYVGLGGAHVIVIVDGYDRPPKRHREENGCHRTPDHTHPTTPWAEWKSWEGPP